MIIQGRISESFQVSRGVRQRCPLSPLLYVAAVEPLLQRLSSDTRITPTVLPVGPPCIPLFGHMDDITIVVPDTQSAERVSADR